MLCRLERLGACLCRTAALFASIGCTAIGLGAADHFSFALPLVWCLFVPVPLLVIGHERTSAREQIASLRSLVAPRAPPLCSVA